MEWQPDSACAGDNPVECKDDDKGAGRNPEVLTSANFSSTAQDPQGATSRQALPVDEGIQEEIPRPPESESDAELQGQLPLGDDANSPIIQSGNAVGHGAEKNLVVKLRHNSSRLPDASQSGDAAGEDSVVNFTYDSVPPESGADDENTTWPQLRQRGNATGAGSKMNMSINFSDDSANLRE